LEINQGYTTTHGQQIIKICEMSVQRYGSCHSRACCPPPVCSYRPRRRQNVLQLKDAHWWLVSVCRAVQTLVRFRSGLCFAGLRCLCLRGPSILLLSLATQPAQFKSYQ